MEQQFRSSFQRLLLPEQRRCVLNSISSAMPDETTVGELVDAAASLGWGAPLGEFSLQDFANALLRRSEESTHRPRPDDGPTFPATVSSAPLEPDEPDEPDEPAHPPREKARSRVLETFALESPTPTRRPVAKAKTKATRTKIGTRAETPSEASPPPPDASAAPAPKSPSKKGRGSVSARLKALREKLDADEPMSLDEAAEVLVPIVEGLNPATMQSLEDFTGIGRRKLRFHIGQLVRHEFIERHGMGRGTYYTACE